MFFSGAKGFHIGLPTALWSPAPSADFHKDCRCMAENLATAAVVTIDPGIYDEARILRAPNSRHQKTGLHKRRLVHELLGPLDAILELAKTPAPFTLPPPPAPATSGTDTSRAESLRELRPPVLPAAPNATAAADWQAAAALVASAAEAMAARRAAGNGTPTLNRATLAFIRGGTEPGGHGPKEDKRLGVGRHRLLFSAAANLAEFGCPPALAVALLEESALDSGLAPREVRRQIDCGLSAAGAAPIDSPPIDKAPDGMTAGTLAAGPTGPPPEDLQAALAKLWGAAP
jgi:hypothetical protein